MHALLLKVKKTIQQHGMLQRGEKVLVAVSGGPDSLALLHLLWEIREELGISLVVGHLNHGLRPEAEKEKSFVRKAAARLEIPFHSKRADVRAWQRARNLSLQEAAREVRYAFLLAAARKHRATKVALGHTADDQAESMIMRFLRGAGTRGLAGIPPKRDEVFIRPLLTIWKEELVAYLQERRIEFLSDPSNRSLHYMRNRVRHELLPILERYNPRIRQALVQTAELFRGEEDFWQDLLKEKIPLFLEKVEESRVIYHVPALRTCPQALRLRLYRKGIEKVAGNLRRMGFPHFLAIDRLLENPGPNKRIRLPQKICVAKSYHALIISSVPAAPPSFAYSVVGPGKLEIPEIGRTMSFAVIAAKRRGPCPEGPNSALLEFDTIDFPLTIRSFQPGDRFQPLGMEGQKKIKDLFIACKIPLEERKRIPLLFAKNRPLWIAGVRIDHRARLRAQTQRVLLVEFH
jgi:tRNA(Ile)-lysidine synthase